MRLSNSTPTPDILDEVGQRLRAYRLQQNITVDDLSKLAGVGSATVKRAEMGRGLSLTRLVRLLRALGRLDAIESFLPEPPVSPIELSARGGRERQRARSGRSARPKRTATRRTRP